jgi:hypothetical protein
MHEAVPPVPEGLVNGYLAFQSMHLPPREKGLRDNWSKIHVTLSTIKSEFKRTFTEEVKSRHSVSCISGAGVTHLVKDNPTTPGLAVHDNATDPQLLLEAGKRATP